MPVCFCWGQGEQRLCLVLVSNVCGPLNHVAPDDFMVLVHKCVLVIFVSRIIAEGHNCPSQTTRSIPNDS